MLVSNLDHSTACCFKKQQAIGPIINGFLGATVEIAALTHMLAFSNSANASRIAHLPLHVRVSRAMYWQNHFLMYGFSTTAL
jgi:hypothetical protein